MKQQAKQEKLLFPEGNQSWNELCLLLIHKYSNQYIQTVVLENHVLKLMGDGKKWGMKVNIINLSQWISLPAKAKYKNTSIPKKKRLKDSMELWGLSFFQ